MGLKDRLFAIGEGLWTGEHYFRAHRGEDCDLAFPQMAGSWVKAVLRAAATMAMFLGAPPAAATQPADPVYDRTLNGEHMVILCDPQRFRLSIRYRADEASLDPSYPRRTVIDPESLVEYFPNPGGGDQYRGGLVRHQRCGPLIIRLAGDFLNANVDGEMGAIPVFAAITVWADNRTLYPQAARAARLTVCDLHLPRWENCPAEYATRVDMAYDPATERMAIDEWVLSGDVLDERYAMSERHSTVQAMLGMWWGRR